MKIISLDLELNQPSRKIIQIGYIIADLKTNKILRKRSLIVDPQEELGFIQDGRSITELTGITEVDIKFNGRSLEDAYNILVMDIKELNPSRTCVQWGQGDTEHLRKQLNLDYKDYIFRNRIWDVKSLYQMYQAFQNNSVAAGLGKAMETMGLAFEGRQHDAMDDAINTYRIFYELGKKLILSDKIQKLIKV